MVTTLYKENLVVSSANFHPDERRWIPCIIVSWISGSKRHFHYDKALPEMFDDKQEADNFGMEAARAWIDNRLSVLP